MSKGKIGFWEAFSIGVGGMVGGGIFAVLGLTIFLSKGATPIAFAIAGIIALVTVYSYVKLSLQYPSEGLYDRVYRTSLWQWAFFIIDKLFVAY